MRDGPSVLGVPGGARTVVDLPALHDLDRLTAALLQPGSWGPQPEHAWLRQRYVELVPQVLPSLVVCLRTGESMPPHVLAAVAESARAQHGSKVPYATVLRGGVPALTAFGRFVRDSDPRPDAHQAALLVGRAGLITQELIAHWVENWRGVQPPPVRAGVGSPRSYAGPGPGLAVEVEPGTLEDSELEMVRMVAEGRSNEQIAARTAYSPQAVKWHLARLMREWGVGNRAALVTAAFTHGVLRVRAPETDRAETDRAETDRVETDRPETRPRRHAGGK